MAQAGDRRASVVGHVPHSIGERGKDFLHSCFSLILFLFVVLMLFCLTLYVTDLTYYVVHTLCTCNQNQKIFRYFRFWLDELETETLVVGQGGGILTRSSLLSLARTHAKMPVTDDAVEELIDTYYMVVEKLEGDIRAHAQLGGNPVQFIESINRMKDLMSLGWMRSMLIKAATNARERGYKRIDIEQIVHIDPY